MLLKREGNQELKVRRLIWVMYDNFISLERLSEQRDRIFQFFDENLLNLREEFGILIIY